jgi:hypothetical protein
MRFSLRRFSLAASVLALCLTVQADEKNGVSLNVTKTTLDRADQRPNNYLYSTKIDRTEALKATIKNTSFKPMPEGEVQWEILVRKSLSSVIESTSGKEKLQALKPSEEATITIGGAEVEGWRDSAGQTKDKIEWQVIVMVDGKEVNRMSSTQAFATLAKRATKSTPKANK